MNIKKLFAIVLTLTLVLAIFAGCSNDKKDGDADTTDPSASASTTEKPDPSKAPTLLWWNIGNAPATDVLKAGMEAISDYTSVEYGVKLDLKQMSWDDFDAKSANIITAGDPFDIMFINNTNYSRFVSMDAFADIKDVLANDAPDLKKFNPQELWDAVTINGGIYAVPTFKDSSMTQQYAWDNEVVEKYNIDYKNVKNMSQLDPIFKEIKAAEPDSTPLMLYKDGYNDIFFGYDDLGCGLEFLGVKAEDKDRKLVVILEQPDVQEKLTYLHNWYEAGIINSDAAVLGDSPKGPMFVTAQGWEGAEIGWQDLYGIEKLVINQVAGPYYTIASIQGSLNAVSKNSSYITESVKFLQACNLDSKLRDMLAYGVEGVNFEYTDDSKTSIEKLNDSWTMSAYSQATFFTMASIAPATTAQWDAVKALNASATVSSCIGYSIDTSSVSDKIAQCNAIYEDYKYELKTGTTDHKEVVPAMIAEMKEVGLDDIMANIQDQLK